MKKIQMLIIALLTMVGNVMAGGPHIYKSSATDCTCTLQAECTSQGSDGSGNIEISLASPDGHQFFAFQMFIVLNEGVALVPDEEEDYGEFVMIPSDRFGNTDKKKAKYGLQIAKKDNGYQIVCLNQQGNAILESEGLLLTIPVKNILQGQGIVGEINEIEFTTLDGNAVRFGKEDISTGLNPLKKKVVLGNIYNLNGQQVKSPRKGIRIYNSKKILNK